MKIDFISDTHGLHDKMTHPLNGGDLLIHSGDISNVGERYQVENFVDWLVNIVRPKYTHGVVFVAGNHDRSFDPKFGESYQKPLWLSNILNELKLYDYGVYYLQNTSINIQGINIWGSPITPWFYGDSWAFNEHRGDNISKYWNEIPINTGIVITHGPPKYTLDYVHYTNDFVGCADLDYHILRVKPLIHCFGHIHQGYGTKYKNDTYYVNASTCTESYNPTNKPIELEVDFKNKEVKLL